MTDQERIELELRVIRAELNGKLDRVLEQTSQLKDTDADHEDRIRKNEQYRYALPITTLLAIASLAVALVSSFGGGIG